MSSCSLVFSAYDFAAGLGAVCGLGGVVEECLQKAQMAEGSSSRDEKRDCSECSIRG